VQIVTLLLLVAALGCLIVGLMMSNTVWIVASLVASVIAVLGIRASRRRAEGTPAPPTQSETELARPTSARQEIAALAVEAAAERTAALFVPAVEPEATVEPETAAPSPAEVVAAAALEPAVRPKRVARVPGLGTRRLAAVSSLPDGDDEKPETVPPPIRRQSRSTRRAGRAVGFADAARHPAVADAVRPDLVVSQPTTDEVAVRDDDPVDEPAPANTLAPLSDKSHENVWVIDGRPRYHLSSCGFLVGHEAEPIPLQQAVEDGFSPCSRCDPDTALASA
jgi:hypothetical protein